MESKASVISSEPVGENDKCSLFVKDVMGKPERKRKEAITVQVLMCSSYLVELCLPNLCCVCLLLRGKNDLRVHDEHAPGMRSD